MRCTTSSTVRAVSGPDARRDDHQRRRGPFPVRFCQGTAEKCHDAGIDTNIETSCYAPTEKIRELLPYLDHICCDVKHMTIRSINAHRRSQQVHSGKHPYAQPRERPDPAVSRHPDLQRFGREHQRDSRFRDHARENLQPDRLAAIPCDGVPSPIAGSVANTSLKTFQPYPERG